MTTLVCWGSIVEICHFLWFRNGSPALFMATLTQDLRCSEFLPRIVFRKTIYVSFPPILKIEVLSQELPVVRNSIPAEVLVVFLHTPTGGHTYPFLLLTLLPLPTFQFFSSTHSVSKTLSLIKLPRYLEPFLIKKQLPFSLRKFSAFSVFLPLTINMLLLSSGKETYAGPSS